MNVFIKKILRKKAVFMLIFWFWMIAILVLSSIPNLDVPDKEIADLIRTDYLIHFLQYFLLAFFYVLWQQITIQQRKNMLLAILTGIVISSIDEFHQLFIPGRAFNPIDLILNISGFVTGLFLSARLLLIIFRSE